MAARPHLQPGPTLAAGCCCFTPVLEATDANPSLVPASCRGLGILFSFPRRGSEGSKSVRGPQLSPVELRLRSLPLSLPLQGLLTAGVGGQEATPFYPDRAEHPCSPLSQAAAGPVLLCCLSFPLFPPLQASVGSSVPFLSSLLSFLLSNELGLESETHPPNLPIAQNRKLRPESGECSELHKSAQRLWERRLGVGLSSPRVTSGTAGSTLCSSSVPHAGFVFPF